MLSVLAPRNASMLCHLPIIKNKWGKDFFKIPKLRVCSEFPPLSKGSCSCSRILMLFSVLCRNMSWRSSARQTRRPWIPRSWHGSRRCLSSGGTCAPHSLSQMEFILTNWCSEPSGSTTLNSKGKKKKKTRICGVFIAVCYSRWCMALAVLVAMGWNSEGL